jgi:uncharacterized protein YkwD
MGRHRRSAAGRAATGRATGVTQKDGSSWESHDTLDSHGEDRPTMGVAPYLNPEAYAGTYAKSEAYLFAADDVGHAQADDTAVIAGDGFTPASGPPRPGAHRRRKKKAAVPVKTGLLGVSAAVAIGAVAVATGAVPGLDDYKLGGGNGSSDKVQAADSPTNTPTEQGGTTGSADSRGGTATSRDSERSTSPSPSPSTSTATPTRTPARTPAQTPSKKPETTPETTPSSQKPTPTPSRTATKKPESPSSAPVTVSAETAAEAQVLKLVNEERARVGCSAVSANSALADLAENFSDAMAAQGFFDHTDPSGASPWDRAAKAGITDLGGENIARGQADAAAVMEAWMNSPGHRANILNCDFKTLGVGVHFGSGGPWWTQDFGY